MTVENQFDMEVGQRQHARVAFSRRARLHIDGLVASVPARIINISARGAYLVGERFPAVGSTFLCRFVLAGDETVLRCRVCRIDNHLAPSGTPLSLGAGVEFLNHGEREKELLTVATGVTPTPVPVSTSS